MPRSTQPSVSPQARGRELAREGTKLWREQGSVKAAATELMRRHEEIPSIQAYRYACGLSQDQAATRYNEATSHQTSLGGTSINAWETWARGKGSGSPPSFSSLLILADAYGRGPLGVAGENLSAGDLVLEAYERLGPEDQMALKGSPTTRQSSQPPRQTEPINHVHSGPPSPSTGVGNIIGRDFDLTVPTVPNGNPVVRAFSLPNPEKGQLLDLTWDTFGYGIERLMRQIKNLARYLDVDVCFGVNEAGLVMATFLASAQFGRCAIGYLRCKPLGTYGARRSATI